MDAGKDPQGSLRERQKTTLTPRVMAGLRQRIKSALTKSLRRVAAEAAIPRVQQVVKELGWRSLREIKEPLILAAGREKGVEQSKLILNDLKSGNYPGRFFFLKV